MAILINTQTQQHCLLQSHHSFGRFKSSVNTFVSEAVISKVHAFIEWHGEYWLLRDVSSNGTWLNDKKLAGDKVAQLNVGDTIAFASKSGYSFEVQDLLTDVVLAPHCSTELLTCTVSLYMVPLYTGFHIYPLYSGTACHLNPPVYRGCMPREPSVV